MQCLQYSSYRNDCDGKDDNCNGFIDENNGDCSGGTPYCVAGGCVACRNAADCSGGYICNNYVCQAAVPLAELIIDNTNSSTSFSTTDKTPTIFGKITDSLAGGDSSQTQDENGPKIASGPKQVDIKVEKKEGLLYKLRTLYTINMDKPWYACDNKEVSDNSKQKCDKYLPFEFTSKENANKFTPPSWMGEEITDTPLGRDSRLLDLTEEEFKKDDKKKFKLAILISSLICIVVYILFTLHNASIIKPEKFRTKPLKSPCVFSSL